jgi:hypothetical protein
MSTISQQTGLSREPLIVIQDYQRSKPPAVMKALGFGLTLKQINTHPAVVFIRLFHHAVGHRAEQRVEALHIPQQPQVQGAGLDTLHVLLMHALNVRVRVAAVKNAKRCLLRRRRRALGTSLEKKTTSPA